MKKIVTFVFLLFITCNSFAQLTNAHWCFREYAHVDFNATPPAVSTCASGGWVPVYGGSNASVSNDAGQLQFYTDGITVWDRTGTPMPNGQGLYGGADAHWNQQHVVIVEKPNHPNLYYIFTVNHYSAHTPSGRGGIHYTVVDMCQGANGDVVPALKNIPLKDHNGTLIDYDYANNTGLKIHAGRITTALNNTQDKVWVEFVTRFNQGSNSERYAYSYLISENGINGQPDGTSQPPNNFALLNNANYPNTNNWPDDEMGSIKVSPNGQSLCDVTGDAVNLYYFNNQNGAVTFNRTVYNGIPVISNPGYGVEFSPNSQFVYFSAFDNTIYQEGLKNIPSGAGGTGSKYMRIYQCPLTKGLPVMIGKFAIQDSGLTQDIVPIPATLPHGGMQLAPDNKIYVCSEYFGYPFHTWLGAIQLPNVAGVGCSFIPNGLQLAAGTFHEGSLPQWVHKTTFTPTNPCPQLSIWPKAYGSIEESLMLVKDKYGNPIIGATELSFTPNTYYNHAGVFPTAPGVNTIQYKSTGITNWLSYNQFPGYAFKSGAVQLYDNNTGSNIFVDGNTGTAVAAPLNLAAGESVLAEPNAAGIFITSTFTYTNQPYTTLYVRTSTGTLSSTYIGPEWYLGKFNPVTNNILVHAYPNIVKVYHFDGTNINYVSTSLMPIVPPYNQFAYLPMIDNQDKIYFIENAVLKCFDYVTSTITTVTLPGFNNNNLVYIENVDPYTGNRCLVYNSSDNFLYCVDVGNSTARKIACTGMGYHLKAVFDNNDVFLTGKYYNPFQVGSQLMPDLPAYNQVQIFITKLNIAGDFHLRPAGLLTEEILLKKASPFEVTISPNPSAGSIINLKIAEKNKEPLVSYSLSIVNHTGRLVLRKDKYIPGTPVQTGNLEKGVYFIELVNPEGARVSRQFVKL